SALLHARSLYEFFTATDNVVKGNRNRLTWRDYSPAARQESTKYKDFIRPLHGRVMHLEKERSGYEAIKKEVVNLTKDIMELWGGFTNKPGVGQYADLLNSLRDKAIAEARNVASQYKDQDYECPF